MSVALDNGALVAVDEKGDIWTAARGQRLQRNGESTTLVQGVMASSAMPGHAAAREGRLADMRRCGDQRGCPCFSRRRRPRRVHGVRHHVFSRGCTRCNASQMSALSVFARGIALIPFVEISDDDVRPYGGWPSDVDVIVIQPSFDIHDGMVIEPGLIRIAYDYGWMRAADVLDPPPGNANAARNACDRIVGARAGLGVGAQDLREAVQEPVARPVQPHSRRGLPTGNTTATHVRRRQRGAPPQGRSPRRPSRRATLGAKLPSMWRGWSKGGSSTERRPPLRCHPVRSGWTPRDASPWVQITTPGDVVPAATVPAP